MGKRKKSSFGVLGVGAVIAIVAGVIAVAGGVTAAVVIPKVLNKKAPGSSGIVSKRGCLDSSATNFNPLATIEDGSCVFPTTAPSSSAPSEAIVGCRIQGATNFNPLATVDDGSCVFPIEGCMSPDATNFNPLAIVDDGSCIIEGCSSLDATNFNPLATVDDGSCIIEGCNNPDATNFNPLATVDDGSCIIEGCSSPDATNFNPLATFDDGSCVFPYQPESQCTWGLSFREANANNQPSSPLTFNESIERHDSQYVDLSGTLLERALNMEFSVDSLTGCDDAPFGEDEECLRNSDLVKVLNDFSSAPLDRIGCCSTKELIDYPNRFDSDITEYCNEQFAEAPDGADICNQVQRQLLLREGAKLCNAPVEVVNKYNAQAQEYHDTLSSLFSPNPISSNDIGFDLPEYLRLGSVGCRDDQAINFCSDCTLSDNTQCNFTEKGCKNPLALNYCYECTEEDESICGASTATSACKDPSYNEFERHFYKEHNQELCKTLSDPFANALQDTAWSDISDLCGSLDPSDGCGIRGLDIPLSDSPSGPLTGFFCRNCPIAAFDGSCYDAKPDIGDPLYCSECTSKQRDNIGYYKDTDLIDAKCTGEDIKNTPWGSTPHPARASFDNESPVEYAQNWLDLLGSLDNDNPLDDRRLCEYDSDKGGCGPSKTAVVARDGGCIQQ